MKLIIITLVVLLTFQTVIGQKNNPKSQHDTSTKIDVNNGIKILRFPNSGTSFSSGSSYFDEVK